jgi:N-acetylmuramoyl-L-alanine amidase
LIEKNVTLTWARQLRAALEKQGIATSLLRDNDTDLTEEQRDGAANAARPAVFISLHAGATGTGVRVYTARLAETTLTAGALLPWDSAQTAFLTASRSLAGSVSAELTKRKVAVATDPVQMRGLNSVAAAAIAVEIMPQGEDLAQLNSPAYQLAVCTAIAEGIAATRPAPEGGK